MLTDGTWAWDAGTGDFTPDSTAVPNALRGALRDEPRHLDLRWARTATDLDLRNTRFRDAIADLAAPMHGIAKDELEGEDVRQHRRTLRFVFAAGMALVVLTLASITTSIFAFNASTRARAQQHRADHQAVLATKAGKLAAQRRRDADHQRGLADARSRDVAAANGKLVTVNGKLVTVNGKLVDQQHQTESQRAAAVKNAGEANQQRSLADQRAGDLNTANGNLVTVNGKLVDQQEATNDQRLAGVARALSLGSQASLGDGVTDRALLLAAQSAKFASRSGGLVSDRDLQPALINALERNPRQTGVLRGLNSPIADVAISPDGSRAAAVSLGRAGVWRLDTDRLLSTFTVPTKPGDLSPSITDWIRFLDRNTVVVAGVDRIDVYHSRDPGATWTHAWSWHARRKSSITALTTTPSTILVTSSPPIGGTPTRVDLLNAAGSHVGSVDLADPVSKIAFAPSGTKFATAGAGSDPTDATRQRVFVHVFDLPGIETAAFGTDLSGATNIFGAEDLRFTDDSRQLVFLQGGFSTPIYRWNLLTHHEVPVAAPPTGWSTVVPAETIGLSPSLDAIVQRDPNRAGLVSIGHIKTGTFTGNLEAPIATSSLFGGAVDSSRSPAFTPDGQSFLLSAGDGVIPIFALREAPASHYARTRKIDLPDSNSASALSPDGRILAWIATTSKGHDTLHLTPLNGSRASRVVSLDRAPGPAGGLPSGYPLTFDSGGEAIAIANVDGTVDIYESATGKHRLHLAAQGRCTPPAGYCNSPSIAFSGSLDSGRIADADNAELWTWELRSGQVVARHRLRFGAYSTFVPRLSASGTRVVVASFNIKTFRLMIRVFDATTGGWSPRRTFDAPPGYDEGLSSDGKQLVYVDGGHVTMFDVERGGVVWSVSGDDQAAWFAHDGTLYTAQSDGTIRVRSAEDGSIQYTLARMSANASSASNTFAFTASDLRVARGNGPDGFTITDWPFGTGDLVSAACRTADRNLTRAEWTQYVGNFDPYEKTCADLP